MSSVRRVAILVDGGFFFHRLSACLKKDFGQSIEHLKAEQVTQIVWEIALHHVLKEEPGRPKELYRVYFYDCPPLDRQVRLPIRPAGFKTTPEKNFNQDPVHRLRAKTQKCIGQRRKMALRLGRLSTQGHWQLNDDALASLLNDQRQWAGITNEDFHYVARQKGIDLKIGLDIVTMAYERLVEQIVLVAGDADFAPSAKIARTKGIDFVLDALSRQVSADLEVHIDGLNHSPLRHLIAKVLKLPLTL